MTITGTLGMNYERNTALISGVASQAAEMATASTARQLAGVTGALDQINQRNAALISSVAAQAGQIATASTARQVAGVTGALDQINRRNAEFIAGVVAQAASLAGTSSRLDLAGLGASVTSQIAASTLRDLATNDVYRMAAEIAGVAEPSEASRGLIERLNGARMSPLARQKAVVSLVWLIVFVALVALAAEYYDEAKVVSFLIGSGAYPLAKDAAAAADRAMSRLSSVE